MALVIPEIFANAVLEKIGENMKLRGLASDVTNMVGEIRNAGDTVHFPKLARTAVAGNITKGTALGITDVDMTDATAVIQHIGAAKRIYDKDAKQIKGAVLSATAVELADAMALKLESDLGTAILVDAVYFSPTASGTAITHDEIQSGLDLFGDQMDNDQFGAIVINSRLRSSFMSMDAFVKSDTTHHTMGNGIVLNGVIGFYFGIPVVMADASATWDATKSEAVTYVLKRDALGYVFQQAISVEEQRPERLFATDLLVSSLYATKLVDLKGVVVLRKTV